jgi:hypothetical protein
MPYGALSDAQRTASFYAQSLADDRESWKISHDESMSCRDVEDRLTFFNSLLRDVLKVESRRRAESALGARQDEGIELFRTLALRNLSKTCASVKETIDFFRDQGYTLEGASEFQSLRTGIEMLVRMSQLSANPRAVHIDAHGHIFEMTGEPVVIAGLDPGTVHGDLKAARTGMGRPLSEIVAGRQHGIPGQTPGES